MATMAALMYSRATPRPPPVGLRALRVANMRSSLTSTLNDPSVVRTIAALAAPSASAVIAASSSSGSSSSTPSRASRLTISSRSQVAPSAWDSRNRWVSSPTRSTRSCPVRVAMRATPGRRGCGTWRSRYCRHSAGHSPAALAASDESRRRCREAQRSPPARIAKPKSRSSRALRPPRTAPPWRSQVAAAG